MTDISTEAWSAPAPPDATTDDLAGVRATPEGWRIVTALWRYADGHGPAR
jgi:hypothetical protein